MSPTPDTKYRPLQWGLAAAFSFDEQTSNNDRGEALKDVIETNLSEMLRENIHCKANILFNRSEKIFPTPRFVVVNYTPPASYGRGPYLCSFVLLSISPPQFQGENCFVSWPYPHHVHLPTPHVGWTISLMNITIKGLDKISAHLWEHLRLPPLGSVWII